MQILMTRVILEEQDDKDEFSELFLWFLELALGFQKGGVDDSSSTESIGSPWYDLAIKPCKISPFGYPQLGDDRMQRDGS
jgi:hypothetical protein